jgi:hypothetical protein
MAKFICNVCGHNECELNTVDEAKDPRMCPWDLRPDFASWTKVELAPTDIQHTKGDTKALADDICDYISAPFGIGLNEHVRQSVALKLEEALESSYSMPQVKDIIEAIVPKNTSMHDVAVVAGINECYNYISRQCRALVKARQKSDLLTYMRIYD